MLSVVTLQKVSVLVPGGFYELPLSLALNHNIIQIFEPVSQFGDESPFTTTLIYE